jgi:putative ABC transport system ATP-binding protein
MTVTTNDRTANAAGKQETGRVLLRLEDVKKVFYTDEVETHALSGIHMEIQSGVYVSLSGVSW